ncbi:alpha/beta fold hydrolase [Gymnodinialimonas sp. 2305UL16-5]|uniref:alpha/beta hydrolase n=1 Tax=Gymnodinialimonas mytili TaxID=3126503 RepID=UPI0030AE216F
MRKLGRVLGRLLALVVLVVLLFVFVLPPEQISREAPVEPDLSDPAGWLAAREARFNDITNGTEARIIWAGAEGLPTDVVILYLHGFSASSEEIRPVPDRVAEALGANLIFARLPGHGRGCAAMAEPRAGDWLDETDAMLALARGIGERVVIMGTSTGGTLASWAATDDRMAQNLAALVLISPNYALANPAGGILELPLARQWVPLVVGAERTFEPINDLHGSFWTTRYPSSAAVTLGTLMREARARDYGSVDVPALFLFSDADQVVSAAAVRDFAANWGGASTLIPVAVPDEGGDPYNHVIVGDALSPAMTDRAVEDITNWLRDTLAQ